MFNIIKQSSKVDKIIHFGSSTGYSKYKPITNVREEEAFHNISESILTDVEFELLRLKSKIRYYHRIKIEDEKRIEMLEKRLNL